MTTHAVIFTPVGQVNRSNQIVQRLSNTIITGLLKSKEQFPNETDLIKVMGVSHITIREALNALWADNLVHTVRGRNGGNFVCENVDGKSSALHPFKAISTDYLSDLGEMHYAVISRSTRLTSRRMTGADIAKFREFVEVLKKTSSLELMTQADMRCLLAIAASPHSARLVNQELQVQAEWASPVTILYRTDSIHTEVTTLYSALADTLAVRNEAESVQFAARIIGAFTYYLIEKKLKCSSN